MKTILRPRSFGMLVLVLILAASIYGFANTNTVPGTSAGDGAGAISGYNVINVTYDIFTDGVPTDIDLISFDLQATVNSVWVSLDNGTTWRDCTSAISGTTVTDCNMNDFAVSSATNLRIVAAD